MNKAVFAISLGLCACVTGALFGTALIGRAVATRLSQETQQLGSALPSFEVLEESVDYGMFHSSRTAKLRLGCIALFEGEGEPRRVPIEFAVHDEISHGLWLGSAGLGLAAIDSTVTLPEGAQTALREFLGDKAPLTAQSVLRFDGSFESDLSLAGVAGQSGASSRLTLKPFSAKLYGQIGGPKSRVHGEIERIDLSVEQKGQNLALELKSLTTDLANDPKPEGMRYLRPGTTRLQVDSTHVTGQLEAANADGPEPLDLELSALKTWSDSKLNDGLLTLETHFEAGIKLNGLAIDKLESQSSLQRIDAKIYEELLSDFIASVFSCEPGAQARMEALLAKLRDTLPTLLLKDPQYSLDKFGLELGEERAQFSYQLATRGITQADLDAAQGDFSGLLIGKGVAKASAQITLGFVARTMDSAVAAARAASADPKGAGPLVHLANIDSKSVMSMLQLMLPPALEAGYVLREGNLLLVQAAYEGGEISLNGKPWALPSLGDLPALLQP